MSTLVTFYGNIASGKTSLSGLILNRFEDTVYLNDDAVFYMLGMGNYAQGYETVTEADLHLALKPAVEMLLRMGKNVILDMPMHNEQRRENFVYPGHQHLIVETGWDDPWEHAGRRMAASGRGYTLKQWHEAAVRLDASREEPEAPWIKMTAADFVDKVLKATEGGRSPMTSITSSGGISSSD